MGGDRDRSAFGESIDATMAEPGLMPGLERRAEVRVDEELKVEYHSFDEFVVSYTEDISRGGLFVASETPLPIGTGVRLRLELPNEGPTLQIIARVAYVLDASTAGKVDRQPGMGMEFIEVEGGPLDSQLDAYFTMNSGSAEPAPEQQRLGKLLVINGDEEELDTTCALLRGAGHEVSSAQSGLDALGLVMSSLPDVVLSTVQAPVMDAWSLLRLLRERPTVAHVAVVLQSKQSSDDDRLRAYRAGADDFIEMPVSDEELLARVERAVVRAKTQRRYAVHHNALRGEISQVALPSVLSLVEMERRTGQLLVVSGKALAKLFIKDGQVSHVTFEPPLEIKPGIHRLFHVLDWEEGRFELSTMDVSATPTIVVPTRFALMEHARQRDEAAAGKL